MWEDETPSLDRIRELLEASQELGFQAANRKEVYAFLERTFWQRDYARQGRVAKGLLRRYVAKLLGKLLIEQTKSRPRHSNDNGLVEAKNGAVIRKHMGYNHIEAHHASAIQAFYCDHLNPYVNFHRPCGQPEMKTGAKGKTKRVYRRYATPCEVFQQLPEAAGCLRPGQSLEALERQSKRHSDTQAAVEMQAAKYKLFTSFQRQTSHA
jgi:hypothetical protein